MSKAVAYRIILSSIVTHNIKIFSLVITYCSAMISVKHMGGIRRRRAVPSFPAEARSAQADMELAGTRERRSIRDRFRAFHPVNWWLTCLVYKPWT